MSNSILDSLYDQAASLPDAIAGSATNLVSAMQNCVYSAESVTELNNFESEIEEEEILEELEEEVIEETPYIPSPVDEIMILAEPLEDLFAQFLALEAANNKAAATDQPSNDNVNDNLEEIEVEELTTTESLTRSLTNFGNQAVETVSNIHEKIPAIVAMSDKTTEIMTTATDVGTKAANFVNAAMPYAKAAFNVGSAAVEIGTGFVAGGPAGAAMASAHVLASSMSNMFKGNGGSNKAPSNPMAAAVNLPPATREDAQYSTKLKMD